MAELTRDTLDVWLGAEGSPNAERFVFYVPSARQYPRMHARAMEMRRQDAPGTMGSEVGLDPGAADMYCGMAAMETLLARADAKDNWPFTTGADGKPVVDSTKFPPSAILKLAEIYRGFEVALRTFLEGGPGNGQPGGAAAVGGEPGNQ